MAGATLLERSGLAGISDTIAASQGLKDLMLDLGQKFGLKPATGDAAIKWAIWLVAFVPGALVGRAVARPVNRALGRFFRWFNKGFDFVTRVYGSIVGGTLRVCVIVLFVYGG